MASLLFLFSLLLTAATTTTTIATNSTTTPLNSNTNFTTLSPTNSTPQFIAHPLPPPQPPQPQPTPQQEAHFNTIIDAILSAGDFSNWANLLATADPSVIPISATIFVPDDDAFLDSSARSPPAAPLNFLDPLLFPYHIIPRRFVFSELLQFPTGARLPTLLQSNTLLITNNSAVNFTVNGAKVTRPDLFQNPLVCVHGVGGVLDYTLFGNDDLPPQNSTNINIGEDDDGDDEDEVEQEEVVDSLTEFEVSGTEAERKRPPVPAGAKVSAAAKARSCSWVKVTVTVCVTLCLLRLLGFLELKIVVVMR